MRKLVAGGVVALLLVVLASPARTATTDPFFKRQWGLVKIQAEQAWPTADGTGTLIAIVDTGVDLAHPDLAAKLVVFPDADFVQPEGKCQGARKPRTCTQDGPQDENGHGTHVAGIAGALTNNGVGVAGTAPGAQILPVRVLDENGSGTTEDVAAGIRYAAEKGADVINLSFGFDPGIDKIAKLIGVLKPVEDAIKFAHASGAVIVAAAGNETFPLCSEPSAHPNVLCVGATDRNDFRAFNSNSDATMTSNYLVAPGGSATLSCAGDIFSTFLRGEDVDCSPEDGYEALAGTSMATPFVSGVASLLAQQGLGNNDIMRCITSTADDLPPSGRDPIHGFGRVNAASAVTGCSAG